MKLDLDTSNLDWNNATVRDYRYIHHLMMMIHERWEKLGIAPSGVNTSTSIQGSVSTSSYGRLAFSIHRYSPGGLLTWDQLSSIYHAMVYLGIYCYFNENNFDESNWVRGDNRKHYNYSLKDMCEIAEFDFFAHPFIPGQPIDYYSQFLYPIKKVLASYTKMATNSFCTRKSTSYKNPFINARYTDSTSSFLPVPRIEIDGRYRMAAGRDKLNFFKNKNNFIDKIKEYYNYLKNETTWSGESPNVDYISSKQHTIFGYEYSVNTTWEDWRGPDYDDEEQSVVSDLVYRCICFNPGALLKCQTPWPAGVSYDVYLCHTTYQRATWAKDNNIPDQNCAHPKFYDSPWPMIIHLKSGTVPANREVIEYVEIPNWDQAPLSHAKSSKGERYTAKSEVEDGIIHTYPAPWYDSWRQIYKCSDHYAAFYYPLFVFDLSSKFQYL